MRSQNSSNSVSAPTLEDIRAARKLLGSRVRETPVWQWQDHTLEQELGTDTRVFLKLELLQYAGTFKPRGALVNMLNLAPEELQRGVTAVSAGNHAIAVAYAAKILGVSAKVVMIQSANPARVEACRAFGAEVVLARDVHQAFADVARIEKEEGRFFVHPFEGVKTILGTATVGLEFGQQVPDLDAVLVPIGGGGLCAGVSTAIKQLQPNCQVFGIEPEGADTMHRSFAAGSPQSIESVQTIADSLGAPHAAPYSFALCRDHVDALVKIDDLAMRQAMLRIFERLKLAVEPAAAATTAALWGPLRKRLQGNRVGLIVCGSNIDPRTFSGHLSEII